MKTNLHEYTEELAKQIGHEGDEEGGNCFFHCYYEWALSWNRWNQFKNLFASGPERVELLRNCGNNFFYFVYHSFFEQTVLSISRLTDPAESGRNNCNRNMSLYQLKPFIEDTQKSEAFDTLFSNLKEQVGLVRELRNKEISHSDYDTILGNVSEYKTARNIDEIEKSLDAIFEIFSFFNDQFFDNKLEIEPSLDGKDEFWLLNILHRGKQAFEAEVKSGEFTLVPDELRKRHYQI